MRIELGVIEDGTPRITFETFQTVRPLLEAQSYIRSVGPYEGDPVDVDLDAFRTIVRWCRCNLVDAYYLAHGVAPDPANHTEPWLEVPDFPAITRKRVAVSRTRRYLRQEDNPFFHQMIRQGLGEHGVFIGLPDEHAWFEELFHVRIEHVQAEDAGVIVAILNAVDLWVGNESFVGALAEGLKKTAVRELNMSEWEMLCAFRRPNLFYV
ncbi:MAG TPA: hypothetical protein VGR45_05790 [Stellaceae bacterium]|nr:hypothetical protein [Stellaceae bacterium]